MLQLGALFFLLPASTAALVWQRRVQQRLGVVLQRPACCSGAQLSLPRCLLAGKVCVISRDLLVALEWRYKSVATAPPLSLVEPLVSSASVALRWWPKALRAAAEVQLGQATEAGGSLSPRELNLLQVVGPVCLLPMNGFFEPSDR